MFSRLKSAIQLVFFSMVFVGLASVGFAQSLQEVMKERGLSQQDLLAAAKTFHPSGKLDEYVVFSSGGQSGQVIVYGVPSMRIGVTRGLDVWPEKRVAHEKRGFRIGLSLGRRRDQQQRSAQQRRDQEPLHRCHLLAAEWLSRAHPRASGESASGQLVSSIGWAVGPLTW